MDRGHLVVERAREVFGNRIDEVIAMVRQDRHNLHGWEEPAHLRSVLRCMQQMSGEPRSEQGTVMVAELPVARRATEPEPGQQREGLRELLDVGLSGLEKMHQPASLTPEERLGLECVVLLYGRPSLGVIRNRLAPAMPALWQQLEECRPDIELALTAVGRICLMGHPDYDWAGTACLVSETTLLTTRRTAELFVEMKHGQWQVRPGITAWMDYRSEAPDVASARYQIRRVIGMHSNYDVALLEVEPPQPHSNGMPTPLMMAAQCPPQLHGRRVCMIGYPIQDSRRSEPQAICRVFRDTFNAKRVQPGVVRGIMSFEDVQIMQHDCCPIGQSSGACIIDLETRQVIGIQTSSRYMEMSTAVPVWMLRDDPLFHQAGIVFADVNREEVEMTASQVQRLARTRYWREVKEMIASMHRRAYGD